jgi:hypothetical protein
MRPQAKRALIFFLCAVLCLALLVCFISHPLLATLVAIFTLLAVVTAVLFHPSTVRPGLQPLSFLSIGGCRAPPAAR